MARRKRVAENSYNRDERGKKRNKGGFGLIVSKFTGETHMGVIKSRKTIRKQKGFV